VVKPGHHGTTFGGNPLACRLGIAVLDTIEHDRLLARVETLGAWFEQELLKLKSAQPAIVDVRGAGMMWGIELDRPAAPVARPSGEGIRRRHGAREGRAPPSPLHRSENRARGVRRGARDYAQGEFDQ
jgi:acetylornithine/succinyldiaminopimelate/putrescine aminotransferase